MTIQFKHTLVLIAVICIGCKSNLIESIDKTQKRRLGLESEPNIVQTTKPASQPISTDPFPDFKLSNELIDENLDVDSLVGSLSIVGNNSVGYTFTLISGVGDRDNSFFTIDGDNLKTSESFDFEYSSTYQILVHATSSVSGSKTFDKSFIIKINNVIELPTSVSQSMGFSDFDTDGHEIEGVLTIAAAADETDFTQYALYWGTTPTQKNSLTPLAILNKSGNNLNYSFPANTPIPRNAKYLLVFTKNSDGEAMENDYLQIVDEGVPAHAAQRLTLTDLDVDGREIEGNLTITIATDETDLTEYVLYWGIGEETKASSTPIVNLAKTGSNITYNFVADTSIPLGVSHLLVYSKNHEGEMGTSTNLLLIDKGLPEHNAQSLTFTDLDLDGGELTGNLIITAASTEADLNDYVLYWGKSPTVKAAETPIASFAKTGTSIAYNFEQNTIIPKGATHLLVFTKNLKGEMVTGTSLVILDAGVPEHTARSLEFTDLDGDSNELSGNLTILVANDESDLSEYALYWGSNLLTKVRSTPIATFAKTGNDIIHTFKSNTPIPQGATRLLAYSKNEDGEMFVSTSTLINPQTTITDSFENWPSGTGIGNVPEGWTIVGSAGYIMIRQSNSGSTVTGGTTKNDGNYGIELLIENEEPDVIDFGLMGTSVTYIEIKKSFDLSGKKTMALDIPGWVCPCDRALIVKFLIDDEEVMAPAYMSGIPFQHQTDISEHSGIRTVSIRFLINYGFGIQGWWGYFDKLQFTSI